MFTSEDPVAEREDYIKEQLEMMAEVEREGFFESTRVRALLVSTTISVVVVFANRLVPDLNLSGEEIAGVVGLVMSAALGYGAMRTGRNTRV